MLLRFFFGTFKHVMMKALEKRLSVSSSNPKIPFDKWILFWSNADGVDDTKSRTLAENKCLISEKNVGTVILC